VSLDALARRLERQGLRVEARAIREVQRAYGDMQLADLLALIQQASSVENPAERVANVERLMLAFDMAARILQQPPDGMLALLEEATRRGYAAAQEMLALSPELLAAFRVRGDREIEYTRHAQARFERYWRTETTRFRQEVQGALLEGLERGQSNQQIARSLRERVAVSRTRSLRIARNEVGNAAAYAMRESQREAGIERYVWRTASDTRVRPEHKARNGKIYRWDTPPADGHPGEAILCRCVALAVIP